MNIELKNVQHAPSLSRETEAFTANLYINGFHSGYVENDGHGGSTNISYADNGKGRALVQEAEAYCKTLPPIQYPAEQGMRAFSVPMNLEDFVDKLLNDHLQKKVDNKFLKLMSKAVENGIAYGVPGESFTPLTFNVHFSAVLAHPNRDNILKNALNKILPKLVDGVMILNTNIPENVYKELGLNENQYVRQPNIQLGQNEQQEKSTGRKR